jgi:molybdate transport system substrate-binding protein
MTRFLLSAALATAVILPALTAGATVGERTVLTVLAASATKTAVLDAVTAFEKSHPDVVVHTSFAGSKAIVDELKGGATADVVVLCNRAADPNLLSAPIDVARYHSTLLVWKGAAARVRRPADLIENGVRLGDGVPNSVLAATTRATLEKIAKDLGAGFPSRFEERVATTTADNEQLAQALASGAIDAAVLYPSDNVPGGTIEVPLPEKYRASDTFAVALVKTSAHAALAKQFETLVSSAQGAALFRAHGSESLR